jgi:hypothetical protein
MCHLNYNINQKHREDRFNFDFQISAHKFDSVEKYEKFQPRKGNPSEFKMQKKRE